MTRDDATKLIQAYDYRTNVYQKLVAIRKVVNEDKSRLFDVRGTVDGIPYELSVPGPDIVAHFEKKVEALDKDIIRLGGVP